MIYEINAWTKKRPDWSLLYIVPTTGGSYPARFESKETAKAVLRLLREREVERRQYRVGGQRKYRLERCTSTDLDMTEPTPFIPADRLDVIDSI